MALNPKPFDATKRIIRSIFKGRPNLFTDVDVNRQFEAMTYFMAQTSGLLGFSGKVNSSIANLSYNAANRLVYDFRILASQIVVRGMSFTLSETRFNGTGTVDNGSFVVYLVGREKVVTFEEDPDMSGVNSPDFQTPLAAADTLIYTDISLVGYNYPTVTEQNIEATIGNGYKLIAVIGSVVPIQDSVGTLNPKLITYASQNTKDAVTQLVGNNISNNSAIHEVVNNVIAYLIGIKEGEGDKVGMTSFYVGPLEGVWDMVSGLGVSNGWQNWAIMDGRNGTWDMRGKYMRGLDPRQSGSSQGTMGSTFGSDEYTIYTSNLPEHDHPITNLGSNWWVMAANTPNIEKRVEYDSRYWSHQNGATVQVSNRTGTSGQGQPMTVTPRTLVCLPVQKIR